MSDLPDEDGDESAKIFLGDLREDQIQFHAYRIASVSNIEEVEELLISLANTMPPQTSLRQAIAFFVIARSVMRGDFTTAMSIRRRAGISKSGHELLGPSLGRTLKSLEGLGLIRTKQSEHDRRSVEIGLTQEGFALITSALDALS